MPHEIPAELTQREFEVFVTRVADALSYGEDVSSFLGSGIDYAQSRPYVPGDSVRDIDCNTALTARIEAASHTNTPSDSSS